MAGYVEDRWLNKRPNPETGKKERTDRWGKGKRYRVAGIPGVRDRAFEKLEDAKAWLKTSATDSGRGQFIDPRDGDITLDEYVRKHWWPGLRVPPSTKEAMEYRVFGHILPLLGSQPLNRIDSDAVNRWVVEAENAGLGAGTARTAWRHLSSILQAAKNAKRIAVNPCRGLDTARPPVKPKQKARRWEREAVEAVRAELSGRYRALTDLGVAAGLRQGEAFGFSPDDLSGGEILVQRQVMRIRSRLCFGPPKGNKERTVPVPSALEERLKEHSNQFPTVEVELPWVDPDRPNLPWESRPKVKVRLLVTTIKGNAINRSDWNMLSWKPALGATGVIDPLPDPDGLLTEEELRARSGSKSGAARWPEAREHGFHVLRHTYASTVLQAGESIVTLAAWLGHSDPAFTLRTYTHFMPEAGSRGVAAMDAWLRNSPEKLV
ncbi:tyrosine-type recombinase/integrase [Kitasatospora sp. NPDC050543]|uniref:tyrosine-type recombinase/integrase n=1 Tax=Kitasatospora sp. NPDC050543 TaxID=3364054 RepID=UPI003787ABDD